MTAGVPSPPSARTQAAPARTSGSLLREGAVWALAAALALAAAAGRADEAAGAGDAAARGKAVYERCLACHAVAHDRVGPRHCGIAGRRAGGLPGYAYSEAMAGADLTWTRATLDHFLADPLATVPGTTMTYDGVKDPRARADLVAYLLSLPPCR